MFGFGSGSNGEEPFAVATKADLALLPVLNAEPTGKLIFVVQNGWLYVLRAALGTAEGNFIIATADDATRQWVKADLLTAAQAFISPEIDTTLPPADHAGGIPTMPGYYFQPNASNRAIMVAAAGVQATQYVQTSGNNATKNNTGAANSGPNNAAFALVVGGAFPAWFSVLGPMAPFAVAAAQLVDLATPIVVALSTAATGGVGYVCKIRMVHFGFIIPTTYVA